MFSRSRPWPTKQRAERSLVLCAFFALACGEAQHRIGNGPGGLEDLDGDGEFETRVGLCDWDADIELIDDLEDDHFAIEARGRDGGWFPFNDETPGATQIPSPSAFTIADLNPARDHSQYGAHTRGSGFLLWGGGVGVVLNQGQPYDASRYDGIVFFARTEVEPLSFRVEVTDLYTSPLGGYCVELPPDEAPREGEVRCFANHGREVTLTREWQAFVVEWDEMAPLGAPDGGKDLETSKLYGVQFQTTAGTTDFDFYVDDPAFLCHRR